MLDILKESPGCNVNEVSEFFDMTRIAVMKHLRVLEEADLVVSKKRGRARHLYFNVVPIQMVYDRWSTEYSALWARSMTGLKYKIESEEENG
ncbi:MAG: ArsR family transcriptional regulator [Thermoanaerobaculia bacterium]